MKLVFVYFQVWLLEEHLSIYKSFSPALPYCHTQRGLEGEMAGAPPLSSLFMALIHLIAVRFSPTNRFLFWAEILN